jgi:hypothetical protein
MLGIDSLATFQNDWKSSQASNFDGSEPTCCFRGTASSDCRNGAAKESSFRFAPTTGRAPRLEALYGSNDLPTMPTDLPIDTATTAEHKLSQVWAPSPLLPETSFPYQAFYLKAFGPLWN